jgi:hypothetical protein
LPSIAVVPWTRDAASLHLDPLLGMPSQPFPYLKSQSRTCKNILLTCRANDDLIVLEFDLLLLGRPIGSRSPVLATYRGGGAFLFDLADPTYPESGTASSAASALHDGILGYMDYAKKGEPALPNGAPCRTNVDQLVEPAAQLDEEQYSQLLAIASGVPPRGWTRWTIALLAEEMVRRGVVARISSDDLTQAIEKAMLHRFPRLM